MVHSDRFDGPPIEFWENALEFPTERTLQDAKSSTFVENWIQRLNARQVAMLRHLLGLPSDTPVRERRIELREHRDALVSFIVVHKFAGRKSRDATVVIATEVLDKATIEIAKDAAGTYDTTALMFAILAQAWRDLEKIFHLDKLHRVGFARMCLAKTPRRPKRKFKDFLESDELTQVLAQFDSDQRDRHKSQFQQMIEMSDSQIAFIRRPHRQSYVLAGAQVVHGFSPDQIILDFHDEASVLNIASHGHSASLDIANRLATAFYGKECYYVNVTEQTYPAQILRFLELLKTDSARDLRLVEIEIVSCPLNGHPDLKLTHDNTMSIGRALQELETAWHWTVDDLQRIPRFKVLFNDHRVSMKIERADVDANEDLYVLRYRDQSLSLSGRKAFEQLMAQEYGIKVVSTEKRGTRSRRS